jgi:3-methyladenine DNA glycosylase AlkD
MSDATTVARALERDLRAGEDRERREATRGYLPTALDVLGLSAGAMRSVIRAHAEEWRGLTPEAVLDLARQLHEGGIHEGRQVAYEILEKRKDAAGLLDLETITALGAGNDNWGSVDTFAALVAGPAWREGRIMDEAVRGWAQSEDRWWRRTALVCTVALNVKSRGGTGDPVRTLDICRRLVGDRDPMVAKGLSWALRALSVRAPDAVRSFLVSCGHSLPARVRREVRNKLETGLKNP